MRRPGPLDGTSVSELPPRCRSCLFWELGAPRPDPRQIPGPDSADSDATVQKRAWCAAETMGDGPPGRVARVDGEVAGYALFAPTGSFTPRQPPIPPASDDALLMATMWVEPIWRERGLGRLLVHEALREAHRREVAAVEVYGDRRFHDRECVLPAAWLLHEGFEVHREHPRYPLLRIDLRSTARWAESLEQAMLGLLERIPRPKLARNGPPVPTRWSGD